MYIEIVDQFPPCEDHAVENLQVLDVPSLAIRVYFANEIYRMLNQQGVSFLLSLDHHYGADHVCGCCQVEQKGLSGGQRN